MSLDELVDMEFNAQESIWKAYEDCSPELKATGWIHEPDSPRLTREQIRARLLAYAPNNHFRIPGRGYINYRAGKR